MQTKYINKVIFSSMMAAITCVATMVIRIPSVGAVGYVNVGDAAVLLSAWLIGGPYGVLAAGIGSALADLLAGYAYYVPGTFVIKSAMAFVAYSVYKKLKQKETLEQKENKKLRIVTYIIAGIPAEIIMIVGYFFYKALLLGKGFAAAAPSLLSNTVQGITCLIIAIAIASALSHVRLPE